MLPLDSPPSPTGKFTSDGRLILFYVQARISFTAVMDDELDFRAGDVIAVTDTPDDGWWWGEPVDPTRRQPGRHLFPRSFTEQLGPRLQPLSPLPSKAYTEDGRPILFYVKALYHYSATIDDEFDFRAGDLIGVTDAPADGWWTGELQDETRRETGRNVFPSNFVRFL